MKPTQERRTNGDRRKIRNVRKAIFPAAGLGTRFLPATKAQPKEMLPIVDKPLVQYGVEEVSASGIPMVVFVTGRGKQAIENHFDVSAELEQELAGAQQFQLDTLPADPKQPIKTRAIRREDLAALTDGSPAAEAHDHDDE